MTAADQLVRGELLVDVGSMSEQVQLAIVTGIVTVALALISSWRARRSDAVLAAASEVRGNSPHGVGGLPD